MTASASSFKVESGIQLLARLTKKPVIENFYPALFQCGPKQGQVIELFSDVNLSFLLTDIMCAALLPKSLNGPEAGILLINCSGHFCFNTLVLCMRNKIELHLELSNISQIHPNKDNVNDLLQKVLKNVFVTEIFDSNQFYATIYNLENILMEHSNISILLLDTISAFYWSEQSFRIMKMNTYLKKVLQKIQKVTRQHKVTIIYTRPEYFSSNKDVIESIESCSENPTSEGINYRIHISYTSDGVYQADIKTFKMQTTKQFHKIKDQIKWI